uniref:Nucleoside diphosphate kinase n=1 Tax=Salmo trutta TaxID=8032 RepID=A0A674AAQ8_SALTR
FMGSLHTGGQAADFYTEHQTKSFFKNLVQFMTSGPGVAMEPMGEEAVSVWRRILGPTIWGVAQKEAPPSLTDQVGTDNTRNAGHGSDSLASAARVSHSSRENRNKFPKLTFSCNIQCVYIWNTCKPFTTYKSLKSRQKIFTQEAT